MGVVFCHVWNSPFFDRRKTMTIPPFAYFEDCFPRDFILDWAVLFSSWVVPTEKKKNLTQLLQE